MILSVRGATVTTSDVSVILGAHATLALKELHKIWYNFLNSFPD